MTTTALFIEHLISGVQALLWFALLVFTLLGYNWIDVDKLKGTEAFTLPIFLAIAYPLGVFVDSLADDIFKRAERQVTADVMKAEGLEGKRVTVMQLMGSGNREFAQAYLGYVRTRVRISRSTALNFTIITIMILIFTLIRLRPIVSQLVWLVMLSELILGLLVVLLALQSWYRASQTFSRQIVRAHKASRKAKDEPEVGEIVIAQK
jgi:hypothetical protein